MRIPFLDYITPRIFSKMRCDHRLKDSGTIIIFLCIFYCLMMSRLTDEKCICCFIITNTCCVRRALYVINVLMSHMKNIFMENIILNRETFIFLLVFRVTMFIYFHSAFVGMYFIQHARKQ